MEDVDLMRRLKRSQLVMLHSRAVTSGVRYRNEGYLVRSLRNLGCMLLYFLRVPTRVLTRLYGIGGAAAPPSPRILRATSHRHGQEPARRARKAPGLRRASALPPLRGSIGPASRIR